MGLAPSGGDRHSGRERRRAGRPSILSEASILDAARCVPVDELSFLCIGKRLGVSAQAIYRYFPNLDQLRSALAVKIVNEAEFLDDQPLGDFEAYVVRFLIDYRDWLAESGLSPAHFEIAYGATKLANGGAPEQLYTRLEDFLETAAREGVASDAALQVWFAITDFMSRSLSVQLPDDFARDFHADLAAGLAENGSQRFPRLMAYLGQTRNGEAASGDFYEQSARALVRGLMYEVGLRGD